MARNQPRQVRDAPQPDLFAQVGGRLGVAAIVDGLYDRLEGDPGLKRLFRNRRVGERERLKLFFETIFGGEVLGFPDVGMQRRHAHLLVSAGESARWLAHLGDAFAEAGVPEATRAAVMDMLSGPGERLVNDGAPLLTLRKAMVAAAGGDIDTVSSLVAEHPRLLDQRAADGATLLWTAARRGRLPLVRWLIARGASVNIPGSAVHMTEVMVSPYCIAVRSGHGAVAEFLLEHGAQIDVFAAAFLGDLDALALHIDAGLVNEHSPHDDLHPVTPLHHAIDGGSLAAAELLLAHGADPAAAGGRLLTSAARQGSLPLVRLLLDHGARATDAQNLGPIEQDSTIARLLVANGLNLNVPIRGQETPLTMMCRADKGEHPEAVASLLALGADPNVPNAKGRTPLAIAEGAGFERTVVLLEAAGATRS